MPQRITDYQQNTPVYKTTQSEEKEIVARVVNKIKLIEPLFTAERIIFKEQISYAMFFMVDNKIYLSKHLLNQDQVQQHESKYLVTSQYLREWKIFAVCTELLGVSSFSVLTHIATFP